MKCNKTNKHKSNSQPIFYYNNNKKYQIKAGGAIFYHIDDKKNLKFLMIKNKNKYEDFGGKTDMNDLSIEETVAREVEEESNKIFTKKEIIENIKNLTPIYTQASKYLLYFYEIKDDTLYDPQIFGDKEIYENISRTVEWVPYFQIKSSIFINQCLNPRLRFKTFFETIDILNKDEQTNAIKIIKCISAIA